MCRPGSGKAATSASLSSIARAWDAAEKKREPTPFCELGPFYKRGARRVPMMRMPGDPGMLLSVAGVVYSLSGEIVPNATLEIWQTNNDGPTTMRFITTERPQADAKSNYGFESVLPGHYPQRVCQHVHYLVIAPGHKPLTTQLYFGADPVFEGDPEKNFSRDPLIGSRELERPVVLKGDPKQMAASVTFDIVLEKA